MSFSNSSGETVLGLYSDQKVSVGGLDGSNTLGVFGNAAFGSGYAWTYAAPTNGIIVQSTVGIGTAFPATLLDVTGGTVTVRGGGIVIASATFGIHWPDGTVQVSSPTAGGGSGDMVLASTQTSTGAKTWGSYSVFNGTAGFNAGVVSSSYSFPGASSTYITTTSANVMSFLAGGGERLRLADSGSVFPSSTGVSVTYGITSGSATVNDLTASQLVATDADKKLSSQSQITDSQIADGAVDGGAGGEIADNSITADDIGGNAVGNSEMGDDAIAAAEMADADHGDVSWLVGVATVDNVAAANIAAGSLDVDVIASSVAVAKVGLAQMSATGVPSGTNFLRGDNTWATPAGSGDVVLAATQTHTGAKSFSSYTTFTGSMTVTNGTAPDVGAVGGFGIDTNAISATMGTLTGHDGTQQFYAAVTTNTPSTSINQAPLHSTSTGKTRWDDDPLRRVMTFIVDGGGSVPSTGLKTAVVEAPCDGIFTAWTMTNYGTGSAVVDIWRDSFSNFPPTVADTITGAGKPTTSSQLISSGTTSGWTNTFSRGDLFKMNVDSVSTTTGTIVFLQYVVN
jgi:hypothetical protein